jgi:hypothetical protein
MHQVSPMYLTVEVVVAELQAAARAAATGAEQYRAQEDAKWLEAIAERMVERAAGKPVTDDNVVMVLGWEIDSQRWALVHVRKHLVALHSRVRRSRLRWATAPFLRDEAMHVRRIAILEGLMARIKGQVR